MTGKGKKERERGEMREKKREKEATFAMSKKCGETNFSGGNKNMCIAKVARSRKHPPPTFILFARGGSD